MSHPTTVRFADEEFQRLERIARQRGETVSSLIRRAVRDEYFVEEREEAASDLLEFVRANPVSVGGDVDEIDREIDEAMSDAAGRQ